MPQAPSLNMGIIWPTDHNDADAWDVVMDTAIRVVIDGHTHAPGSGATVAMSWVKVDADISWAFGGSQRAITDLKAIDFSPQAAAAVSSLSGALFLNSADSELYYRTTSGANVKLTNGATLNVAAFIGGIGGDYTAAGALEVFDDATDAYWFQQQVGASVRQFAKMRSADLQLFEFKAVGATPVPTQAVTLKSPAALAVGYSMTMPAALPVGSTRAILAVDSSGNVSAGGSQTIVISAASGQQMSGTMVRNSDGTVTSTASAIIGWSVPIKVGDRVQSFTIAGFGDGAVDPLLEIFKFTTTGGTSVYATQAITNAPASWVDTTATPGAPTALAATESLLFRISCGAGTFTVNNVRVVYDHP